MDNPDGLVFNAKLAEQMERYDGAYCSRRTFAFIDDSESKVLLTRETDDNERRRTNRAIAYGYVEMTQFMRKLLRLGLPLSQEEVNLFSVAYKNIIGARRAAWRIVSSMGMTLHYRCSFCSTFLFRSRLLCSLVEDRGKSPYSRSPWTRLRDCKDRGLPSADRRRDPRYMRCSHSRCHLSVKVCDNACLFFELLMRSR